MSMPSWVAISGRRWRPIAPVGPDEPRSPAALGSLQLVTSKGSHRAEEPGSPDPSTGRALLELAVMVGLLVVVLILVVIAIFGGAVNL